MFSRAKGIPLVEKGAASGVATLDATGKVPVGQLPLTFTGPVYDPNPNITPAAPTGLTVTAGLRKLIIMWSLDDVTDAIAYYEVYIDTTTGFTPAPANRVFQGPENMIAWEGLPNTTYYVRVRAMKWSGTYSSYTAEVSATTGQITIDDLPDALITNAKISNISADKITSGYISAERILAGSIGADKIAVAELSAIIQFVGTLYGGTINGTTISGGTITGATIKTSNSGKRLELSSGGMKIVTSDIVAGKYGTFKYGAQKYGSGILAVIGKIDNPPICIETEQVAIADMHLPERAAVPTGPNRVGDVCNVGGVLKVCTTAGSPGVWAP